jgi:hypothetical protein
MIGVAAVLGDAGAPDTAWQNVMLPALASIPPCAGSYGAEGSWQEGVGYWGYASKYLAFLITSLDSAFGTDFGLGATPGLSLAGRFPVLMTGASGAFFDWADSWAYTVVAYGDWDHAVQPYQGFFGLRFNDSAVNFFNRRYSALFANVSLDSPTWAGLVEALLYFSPDGGADDLAALPSAALYRGINVGVFAGSPSPWAVGEPNAPVAGSSLHFKGGNTAYGHGHLDLGTWVFDLRGVRIVEDEGADNYNIPDYFGPTRWKYPRLNSELHNVARYSGASHSLSCEVSISAFNFSETVLRNASSGTHIRTSAATAALAVGGYAVADISACYVQQAPTKGALVRAVRGWAALGAGLATALIVDELEWAASGAGNTTNATFSLHTRGVVALAADAQSATVRLNSSGGDVGELVVETSISLLSAAVLFGGGCPGARLIAESIALQAPQYGTPGLMRVSAFIDGGADLAACVRVAVAVGDALPTSGWALRPISEWEASGPVAPMAA